MTIHLLSADHRYQSLDEVARLSRVDNLGPKLMRALPYLRGAVVVRTCNRLAILVDAPSRLAGSGQSGSDAARAGSACLGSAVSGSDAARAGSACPGSAPAGSGTPAVADDARAVLAHCAELPLEQVHLRHLAGHQAHLDLFATAAGLESMVVGEREIAGQLRRAFHAAWEEDTLSCDLGRALEHASRTSRLVATHTGLASSGRSVVAVGLDLAAQALRDAKLRPLKEVQVVLVGTGAYAGATVTALRELGATNVRVYSRSERAQLFAQGRGIGWVDEAGLAQALDAADLVVTCRGLGSPVLTREIVQRVKTPLVILDLALQRDVEAAVADLAGISYIDLLSVQRAVPQAHGEQVRAAREIVAREVEVFERSLGARSMDPVVRRLRDHVDEVVGEEISRLRPVDGCISADDATRALRHLAARLIHNPTVMARKAGESGQQDAYLEALQLVLGMDASPSDTLTVSNKERNVFTCAL